MKMSESSSSEDYSDSSDSEWEQLAVLATINQDMQPSARSYLLRQEHWYLKRELEIEKQILEIIEAGNQQIRKVVQFLHIKWCAYIIQNLCSASGA